MAVPVPNLDNRTFEQLLKEARRSISNYAPEWTNHNPADPGITLIELIAWLAEITSYRVNLVTEEHLLKYLELLGVRPESSQSAITDLSFEAEKIVLLKEGTVFLAEKNGEKIDFELLEDININPLKLEKIIANEVAVPLAQSSTSGSQCDDFKKLLTYAPIERPLKDQRKGTSFVTASTQEKDSMLQENSPIYGIFERSNQNENADLFFAPFGLNLKENSELYLGFKPTDESKNEISLESLNFMCYLYEKDLIDPGKHGKEAESEYEFESARLKWEISVSPEGKQWKEVIPKDGTRNFTKSGSLLFTRLEGWVCSSINFCSEGNENYWLRCTLLDFKYEYPPRIERIRLNTAQVIQKKILTDLVLGISSGLPGQVFKLPETPVLRGSIKLALDGEWKEVEDFDVSTPTDPHFTLESLKGEIRFGDGLWGKIPPKDIEIRVIKYETGRGERGNLQANSNWVLKEKDISGLVISNFKPATGGTDEESIDEAFERFIRDLRVPYRAVTSEDFEYIARKTPGLRVAQAKAIPNFICRSNTEEEGIEEEGTVTVVVVPFSPLNTFENPPTPSTDFINAITKHINKHRLLGTFVCVVPPKYIKVKVQVTLGISKGFSETEIRKEVIGKLELFLHPIRGDFSGKGWPVGKNVYRSEIYQLITEIEGVDFVEKIEIYDLKGDKTEKEDLKLPSTATVYSGEHSVEILKTSGKRR